MRRSSVIFFIPVFVTFILVLSGCLDVVLQEGKRTSSYDNRFELMVSNFTRSPLKINFIYDDVNVKSFMKPIFYQADDYGFYSQLVQCNTEENCLEIINIKEKTGEKIALLDARSGFILGAAQNWVAYFLLPEPLLGDTSKLYGFKMLITYADGRLETIDKDTLFGLRDEDDPCHREPPNNVFYKCISKNEKNPAKTGTIYCIAPENAPASAYCQPSKNFTRLRVRNNTTKDVNFTINPGQLKSSMKTDGDEMTIMHWSDEWNNETYLSPLDPNGYKLAANKQIHFMIKPGLTSITQVPQNFYITLTDQSRRNKQINRKHIFKSEEINEYSNFIYDID